MKKALYILIFISATLLSGCGNNSNEIPKILADILPQLDSLSLEEMETSIKKSYTELKAYSKFMETFSGGRDTKHYKDGEEEVVEALTFEPVTFSDESLSSAEFRQNIDYPNSNISFIQNTLTTPEWYNHSYIKAKKIYFSDGTTEDCDYVIDDNFDLPSIKHIDSIQVELQVKYPININSVILTSDNDKVTKNGGEIILEKIKDNSVQIILSDSLLKNYIGLEARDHKGQYIDDSGHSSSSLPPGEAEKAFKKITEMLGELVEDIDAKKFKTKEDLKNKLIELGSEINVKETDKYYITTYYNGNPKEVILHFAGDYAEESFSFVARRNDDFSNSNLEKNLYLSVTKTDKYIIFDKNGNIVVDEFSPALYPTDNFRLEPLNDYYYIYSDYYTRCLFRVNTDTKKMEIIREYNTEDIEVINDKYIIVSKNGYKGILNEKGELIAPIVYETFSPSKPDNNKYVGYKADETSDSYVLE